MNRSTIIQIGGAVGLWGVAIFGVVVESCQPSDNRESARLYSPAPVPSHAEALAAASNTYTQTAALEGDIRRAIATFDSRWYQQELRDRPRAIGIEFQRAIGRASEADRKHFAVCGDAADQLGLVAYFSLERPSDHYREQWNGLYRDSFAACARAIASK